MFLNYLAEADELAAFYKEFMAKAGDATKRSKHDAWADSARLTKVAKSLQDLEDKLLFRVKTNPVKWKVVYDEAALSVRYAINKRKK